MNKSDSLASCGCGAVIFAFNVFIGGWSVNYLLAFFALKTIPFFWAAVIGFFAAELSVPVAVVIAILRSFGVV